jgi:hypothetical protein
MILDCDFAYTAVRFQPTVEVGTAKAEGLGSGSCEGYFPQSNRFPKERNGHPEVSRCLLDVAPVLTTRLF